MIHTAFAWSHRNFSTLDGYYVYRYCTGDSRDSLAFVSLGDRNPTSLFAHYLPARKTLRLTTSFPMPFRVCRFLSLCMTTVASKDAIMNRVNMKYCQ